MTRVRAVRPGTPPRLTVAELRRLGKPQRRRPMDLPDLETVAAIVQRDWMEQKRAGGTHSRVSEWGEELMVPYDQLSDRGKEQNRALVRTVYAAIEAAQKEG
jgi:hypothetical protein